MEHSSMKYLVDIGIILLAANLGGILSKKMGQPAVLGQILVGVILGMGLVQKTEIIEHLAEMGVIFLMFIAGLETDVQELIDSSKSSSLVAIGGVVFPLLLVGGSVYLVTKEFLPSLFMGIVATATSVSISVQTLREIGKLRTKQGIGILGAAIIDDIIGIILLTLMVGMIAPSGDSSIVFVLGKIVLFFVITFAIGWVITRLLKRYCDVINFDDKIVTYAIVICFLLAFMSEELGVASITGAFFSGVVFSMTAHRHKISHEVNKISSAIFTPIFFVGIGMGVDLSVAATALGLGSIFIVTGALGKVIGCGIGAKLSGFETKKALQIGIGMIPRAEVAIIIASLGVRMDIIGQKEMAATIVMVLVTTVITPSLLKWSFNEKDETLSTQNI